MEHLLILLATAAVSGCQPGSVSIPPEVALSGAARAEAGLPAGDELTRPTKTDAAFVTNLNPETVKAVEAFLRPESKKITIHAARPVGSYLLLWIRFPGIADGGIDLIWSVEKNKAVGTFLGGYRG